MTFSNLNRTEMINTLTAEEFDVLIIGGGITGAGIALDAATRGMKTALVEMQDFAAGTSSRSTKLVHGGLRYLKQYEVKMVAEVGKERAIVYENGPHVTTPEWMLLPLHKGGTFGKFSTSIGLRVYDFLAGVRKSERRSMLNVRETLSKEPLIKKDGLKGGGYYVEYRTDDARLTIEVMKAAAEKGALPVNYLKVENLLYSEQGIVCGAAAADQLTGRVHEIRAKKVINAAGPWVDSIRDKDGSKKGKTLRLTKGVHLVIDQSKFPLKQAVYFDTPDKRMVFAIPRSGKTYVGTTDTFYDSDPVNPKMTASDRTYIINAINFMFPSVKIAENDIESSWAGVRPLIWEEGKDPSEISRKDEIWESDTGLLTIAGGKLTGYRKMAETIVDLLAEKFKQESNRTFSSSITKTLPISGGDVGGSSKFREFIGFQTEKGTSIGLSAEQSKHLVKMYGSNVGIIFNMIEADRIEAEKYGLPIVLWAKLKYAIEHEMAATPVDFFNRRTGALLFDIETVRNYQGQVISYMADAFKWDKAAERNFENQLNQELSFAITPADQD
ncbi:glycerol-3-phosphate dehydrogenase/oxidase [Bacillus firmus]|uniref:glycerol-3-phosphate dehydrogenase/oxidase n=1 Tax=Cytobacillus firmus TaxID=1399 RepID=UPI0015805D9B|nr:glycerol-3-phosphate dehydrogenase/oxidase [Cytobacillus firmus]MBG9549781.1 glycerol-3-phosphate dehydrogenase [Cytobacillus firmus]MBG9604731.1 glycerol-3-phosphate dehydrogenase [Cytobacillus firmus]MBG9653887.1 glycerol-3-phosphate dehydrogenase [Cytobacillus firmus]MDD9311396.1 glycerol-3-phosphate dehydrogenase/oxidase [Cytobacillus firmus]MED1908688.1 glycerol-3-phosphate dehydrogenase/oxidase [Cytobacillus firmus]